MWVAKNGKIVPGVRETHNKGINRLTWGGQDGYNHVGVFKAGKGGFSTLHTGLPLMAAVPLRLAALQCGETRPYNLQKETR